jgi:hypothetical protein
LTFAPTEDKAVVLHNPDMGWVLYENYPLDQRPGGASTLVNLPNEPFPEVDAVAIMFSWQDVEKSKDVYDFSKVDYAYDYWKSRGKTIHLRMSVESLLWWSGLNPPTGQGVPGYVLDAMPPEKKQVRTCEGLAYVVVDARDTYYRDRLGKFLRAVAKHFRTRPVTLTDLRGFGLWGEWHSGYKYPTLEDRIQTLKQIIDVWSANLPGHTLALSYSYDPDSPPEYYAGPTDSYLEKCAEQYKDFARYSGFDYALSRPNVVLRRDGVGGCVHSNERRFIREAFDKHRKGTFVAEFCGGYSTAKNGGDKQVRWMIDDALSLHPNYINLLGWQTEDALLFCSERPDLIKHGLLNMGYRLVPVEISLPAKTKSGCQVDLRSLWANRAEGCALMDFKLKIVLADAATGKTAYETDLGPIPTSKWARGSYYAVNRSFTLGKLRSGDYDLLIQLVDPRTAKPIQLPLRDAPQPGLYRVGRITISTGR